MRDRAAVFRGPSPAASRAASPTDSGAALATGDHPDRAAEGGDGLFGWVLDLLHRGPDHHVEHDVALALDEIARRSGAARVRWVPRPAAAPLAGPRTWVADPTTHAGAGAGAGGRDPALTDEITCRVVGVGLQLGELGILPGPASPDRFSCEQIAALGADVIALILRGEYLRRRRELHQHHLATTRSALDLTRSRLAEVFADERRRLVRSVLSATDGATQDLVDCLVDLVETLDRQDASVTGTLARIHDNIEHLVEEFRRLARGTYPLTLRAEGPAAAMAHLGHSLRHRLIFTGDTPMRAGWEVESSLYWALSAVTQHVDGWTIDGPIELRWQRSQDQLRVCVIARPQDGPDGGAHHRLLQSLRVEVARLSAFGGELTISSEGPNSCVCVRMPESIGPAGMPPLPGRDLDDAAGGTDQPTGDAAPAGRPRERASIPAGAEPEAQLAAVITRALGDTARPAGGEALTELADLARAASGARACLIEHDDPSDPHGTGRWGVGDLASFDRPDQGARSMDVPIGWRGVTVGFLRLDQPEVHRNSPNSAVLRALAACAAVLLAQRQDEIAGIRLRQSILAAQSEMIELRRSAAADLDQVRQDLEHDLHDGAQAELASLRIQLGLLEHSLVDAERPSERTLSLASRAVEQAHAVRDRIRATASGVAPAVLHQEGLVQALRTKLPQLPEPGRLRIDVEPGVTARRYPEDVELTAYFVCLEAVTNTSHHAPGADVLIRIESLARGLAVHIHDTGPGFDLTATPGALRAIRQRARHAAAELTVRSSPRHGTAISLVLPY